MTQDIEKFRAGFEAWASKNEYELERYSPSSIWPGITYKSTATAHAWNVWTAAKREASTEPSSTSTSQGAVPGARTCEACEGTGIVNQCVICGSAEPRTASCGSDDPRALCNWSCNSGAAPGDALDAARYRAIRTKVASDKLAIVQMVPDAFDRAVDMVYGSAIATSTSKGK